jgi:5-methylcytosine-specific restriction endonuclease McrA
MYFVSQNGSVEIKWNNIIMVNIEDDYLILESTKKNSVGKYKLNDIKICYSIIDYLIKTNKRLIMITKSSSRKIAQEVKTEVWQRDGGKCVECGAIEYLEFDHIIPLSKGGASSVNNLQLLCRKCNSKKSDKI